MSKHIPDCTEKDNQTKAEIEAYESQWPDHCRKCGGWGGGTYSENQAPHGSGRYWLQEMFDICSCWASGICPRCGKRGWAEDDDEMDSPCKACGWESKDGGKPESHECFCLDLLCG